MSTRDDNTRPAAAAARAAAVSRAPMPSSVLLLCADDYAMTEGVSRGIEELIAAGRLSATSAMTTSRHWPVHGRRITALKSGAAIGLHFNLTLGRPLTSMRRLAPTGDLPPIGALTKAALSGAIDAREVEAEAAAQIAAFADHFGALPDFIDGHQHVHALPRIRDGVLAALRHAYGSERPLVRDPSDRPARILERRRSAGKALLLSALATGFRRALARDGFFHNDSFAGVSDFAPRAAAADFAAAGLAAGRLHLVMCHPGYVDSELESLDPLTERRRVELELLMADATWRDAVWHPAREADGRIDWSRLGGHAS